MTSPNSLPIFEIHIQPAISQQALLMSTLSSLRPVLAAVTIADASEHLPRHIHIHLDQPETENLANIYLAANLPPTSDISVMWLAVKLFKPKHRLDHPEKYLVLFSKNVSKDQSIQT